MEMKAPETVNGYPVIAQMATPAAPATRAGRVILVDRGGEFQRYVTAWQGRNGDEWDDGWHIGHYISDLDDAKADFLARCKRGL